MKNYCICVNIASSLPDEKLYNYDAFLFSVEKFKIHTAG